MQASPRPQRAARWAATQAAFFARHIVLHTHVEKCAGSTLCYALSRMFGTAQCLDLRQPDAPRPEALTPAERAGVRLLSGHFRAGSHEDVFDRRPVRIALVRDPIDRLLSFLGFLSRSPGHPEYPRFGALHPEAAVAAMLAQDHRLTADGQCRVLSGERRFQAARRAVEEDYLVVLPHTRWLDVARLFAEALGLPRPNPRLHRNAAPPGLRPRLDPATEALLRAATAEDAQLVAWVEENADRLLARARERLAALVADA
jgi:hypothetical protein